jgi:multicomponent Na+:H+ antiporter subunit F
VPDFLHASALVILLAIGVSLFRVYVGPSRADRIMGVQLVGTSAVALLVLLSMMHPQPGILDLALLLALLAAFSAIGFIKSASRDGAGDPEAES